MFSFIWGLFKKFPEWTHGATPVTYMWMHVGWLTVVTNLHVGICTGDVYYYYNHLCHCVVFVLLHWDVSIKEQRTCVKYCVTFCRTAAETHPKIKCCGKLWGKWHHKNCTNVSRVKNFSRWKWWHQWQIVRLTFSFEKCFVDCPS